MTLSAFRSSVFSFFSGAGFLDLGFEHSGFEVAFANEFDESFADAYRHSRTRMGMPLPKYGVHVDSVELWLKEPRGKRLAEWVKAERKAGATVGFVGGPPCPDFSVGGKNAGRHGENGRLTSTYFHLITEQKPDWFLFENVRGLWRTKRHRAFFDEMTRLATSHGYAVSCRLINAIEYGAPQDRERIIMVGVSRTLAKKLGFAAGREIPEHEFPWTVGRTHDRSVLENTDWPTTSAFGATARKPRTVPSELTVAHWFARNNVDSHPNAKHVFTPRAGLARFETVLEGDDSRKSYKRLHRWRYSPTACYGNNEVHLHPTQARRLTVAEVLAIQSLPPEFTLPDSLSLSAMFKTVGNGVPYLAGVGLAQMIRRILQ